MSEFYDDMRAVVAELMSEFKQGTVAYVKMIEGTGGTPDNPALPTPTMYPIDAVVRGVQYKYVQRGLAVATDLQVTFAFVFGALTTGEQELMTRLGELFLTRDGEQVTVIGAGDGSEQVIAPLLPDFVDVNGIRHKIVQVIGKPAGEPVAYTLIVRR